MQCVVGRRGVCVQCVVGGRCVCSVCGGEERDMERF